MINNHSQNSKSVNGRYSDHSQNLFTEYELVNDQAQNDHSQAINSHSQESSARSVPREGYAPQRGANPAGEGARGESSADILTRQIRAIAETEFRPVIEKEHGGLVGAFERVLNNPSLMAKARVAAVLVEREQRRGIQ